MSFNIHHGVGMDGQLNLERIARVIQEAGVEIIGLQEVDKHFGSRSDFTDQAKVIAEILGFNYCFGGNLKVQDGEYGNAILSKFPIENCENILLTSKEEQRGCLRATINVKGTPVNFYNTHLALDLETRKTQVKEIIEMMSGDQGHKILTGDFNTRSMNDDYQLLIRKGGLVDTLDDSIQTFSSTAPTIRIDYIFTTPTLNTLNRYAIKSAASDHLPIVAELRVDG